MPIQYINTKVRYDEDAGRKGEDANDNLLVAVVDQIDEWRREVQAALHRIMDCHCTPSSLTQGKVISTRSVYSALS